MKLRIRGTSLTSERLEGPFENHTVVVCDGEIELGLLEYIAIRRGGVTRYGWRPLFSGWSGARLLSKEDAAAWLANNQQRKGSRA
jgi:hypothetical protein